MIQKAEYSATLLSSNTLYVWGNVTSIPKEIDCEWSYDHVHLKFLGDTDDNEHLIFAKG